MGLPEELFVGAVPKRVCCPLCMEIMVRPVMSTCQHPCCEDCFNVARATNPLCVVCRQLLREAQPARFVREVIDEMEVRCEYCREKMTVEALLGSHAKSCRLSPTVLVPCPNAPHGCPVVLLRKDMPAHERACRAKLSSFGSFVVAQVYALLLTVLLSIVFCWPHLLFFCVATAVVSAIFAAATPTLARILQSREDRLAAMTQGRR
eukprot:m.95681 g.95681  ORF g.95681 m.95681 type:complete len:206 (+) comp15464_c0_seq2:104-721(+)